MTRRLLLLFALMSASMFAQNRVFELRTYIASNEDRFEALKARFRDHTIRIFARHGMESIGYWIPQDPDKKNTLIYVIAHKSREQATKNWVEFRADPEWQKVAAESEKGGKILQSSPTFVFMDPADFSKIK